MLLWRSDADICGRRLNLGWEVYGARVSGDGLIWPSIDIFRIWCFLQNYMELDN